MPSLVGCSVMSVSQTRSGAGALKFRWTRSSWTAGPGRLQCLAALLRGRRPDPVLRAQPPDPAFAHVVARSLELVGDEAVAELGVVGVDVDDGVDQVGVVESRWQIGSAAPLVEGLGGEAEHPAGQPHREPLGGQFTDQRVRHFGRVVLGEVGGGATQDLVLHLEPAVRRRSWTTSACSAEVRPSLIPSSTSAWRIQRCTDLNRDLEVGCDFSDAQITSAGDTDDITLELRREPLWHGFHPFGEHCPSLRMSTKVTADPNSSPELMHAFGPVRESTT